MTSFRSNENEVVLLLSRRLIVAGLFIACSCKKMATQRPDGAEIFSLFKASAAVGKFKMRNVGKNSRQ